MIRKLTSLLITLVFLLCLTVPASAESNPLVVDDAGLLLPDEIAALEEKAAELKMFSELGVQRHFLKAREEQTEAELLEQMQNYED